MNRRLVSPLLLAGSLATAAFAASAQTVSTSVGVDATVQAQPAEPNVDAAFDADAKREIDRYCLRHTGSRIVARHNTTRSVAVANADKKKMCAGTFGRAYSREDLDRTGEVDIADALRKLDPSIH